MLIAAALIALWALVAYLAMLGLTALFRPSIALAFLFGFAQTRPANNLEGGARLAIGLAFIIVDEPLGWSPWGLVIGLFLTVSALALLLLPQLHRKVAPRLVALVDGFMPLLGFASLLLAILLASAINAR